MTLQMILVLQHRKDRLPRFLAAIVSYQHVAISTGATAGARQVMDAMHSLFLYWYVYSSIFFDENWFR